jgi:hypothetical protein
MHNMLGIYRFVLPMPDQRVFAWQRVRSLANIPKPTVAHMVAEGLRRGAKPTDWMGAFVPIAIHEMAFEAWDGNAWVSRHD